jgi:hypothetical protein
MGSALPSVQDELAFVRFLVKSGDGIESQFLRTSSSWE